MLYLRIPQYVHIYLILCIINTGDFYLSTVKTTFWQWLTDIRHNILKESLCLLYVKFPQSRFMQKHHTYDIEEYMEFVVNTWLLLSSWCLSWFFCSYCWDSYSKDRSLMIYSYFYLLVCGFNFLQNFSPYIYPKLPI